MPQTNQQLPAAEYPAGPLLPIEQEAARGIRFTYIMLNAIHRQTDETVRLVEGLNRLLFANGITSEAEWTDALDKVTRGSEI